MISSDTLRLTLALVLLGGATAVAETSAEPCVCPAPSDGARFGEDIDRLSRELAMARAEKRVRGRR